MFEVSEIKKLDELICLKDREAIISEHAQKSKSKIFDIMITELKLSNVSPRTIEAYLYHNTKFIEFIKKRPHEITTSDVKSYLLYLMSKQAKTRTVRLCIASLNYYYSKILKRNIMKEVRRPKLEKTLPQIIEKEEILRMINVTKNIKHKLLIELLYSSGVRISEAMNIRKIDINEEKKIAIVKAGKGRKDRFVILSEYFLKDYKLYKNFISDFLFTTNHGRMTVRTAEQIISNAAKNAGIQNNVHPHMFRTSFATHLLDEGIDISLISSLLGHSSVDTTRNCYIKNKTFHLQRIKSPLD